MQPAPIAIFAYNRPDHLRRVVEALKRNDGAAQSPLYVFCDGAKSRAQADAVAAVRRYVRSITGFARLTVTEHDLNLGLATSIISGINRVLGDHDRVVVVEDDILTSPFFLRFINAGLDTYDRVPEVASIHGYCYPIAGPAPATFFMRGADCWGWGTWRRAWQHFESDGAKLLAELEARQLIRDFDLDGTAPHSAILRDFVAGRNNSWAVRWHASTFLEGMLTLYPGASLVRNIGADGSGTHSGWHSTYDVKLAEQPVAVHPIPVVASAEGRALFADFFRASVAPKWDPLKPLTDAYHDARRKIFRGHRA